MLPRRVHNLTACLALALVGLVGGLGTGMHSVFDCCHSECCASCCRPNAVAKAHSGSDACDCVFCHTRTGKDASTDARWAGNTTQQHPGTYLAKSHADCAICKLLAKYHSTTISRPDRIVAWANSGTVSFSLPTAVAGSSCRLEPSRGPPTASLSAVAAVTCG